jgi:hypothetical protein
MLVLEEWLSAVRHCSCRNAAGRKGHANDNSCPSGSSIWKYRSPHEALCGFFRLESQLVELSSERIHIRDVEDESTPAFDRLTLFQITAEIFRQERRQY